MSNAVLKGIACNLAASLAFGCAPSIRQSEQPELSPTESNGKFVSVPDLSTEIFSCALGAEAFVAGQRQSVESYICGALKHGLITTEVADQLSVALNSQTNPNSTGGHVLVIANQVYDPTTLYSEIVQSVKVLDELGVATQIAVDSKFLSEQDRNWILSLETPYDRLLVWSFYSRNAELLQAHGRGRNIDEIHTGGTYGLSNLARAINYTLNREITVGRLIGAIPDEEAKILVTSADVVSKIRGVPDWSERIQNRLRELDAQDCSVRALAIAKLKSIPNDEIKAHGAAFASATERIYGMELAPFKAKDVDRVRYIPNAEYARCTKDGQPRLSTSVQLDDKTR